MKIHHTLICFFLTLQDGDIGLIDAQRLYEGTEGGNITVGCTFDVPGRRALFCKEICEGGGILIETQRDSAQRGRYRLQYNKGALLLSNTRLYVTITELTKSDSGHYRCGLDTLILGFLSVNVEIRVRDAPLTVKPHWTEQSVFYMVLSLCLLMVLVLLLVVVLLLLYKGKIKSCCGLNRRGDSEPTEMEVTYENNQPASIYQSLDQSTRDNDQTYCTLTHT